MARGRTRLWRVVEQIVLEHYDELRDEDLRGSYYIVREYLTQALHAGDITQKDFDKFVTTQGYATYSQDLWSSIEARRKKRRPRAKSIGVLYDRGEARMLKDFAEVFERARGFIFVEKAGDAAKLVPLTRYGWTVIAAQGFSTREIRQRLHDDERPALVLHDADKRGDEIFLNFVLGSRRTAHLDLVKDNAIDLGLHWSDVESLNLPLQPEAERYRSDERRWRVELSALNVLKARGVSQQPLVDYVCSKLRALGMRITPAPMSYQELLYEAVADYVRGAFTGLKTELLDAMDIFDDAADEIASTVSADAEGEAIDIRHEHGDTPDLPTPSVDILQELKGKLAELVEDMRDELTLRATAFADGCRPVDEDEYEEQVLRWLGVTLLELEI